MSWLVYIPGPRGPSPRVIYDVDKGGNPVLNEVERKAGILAQHRLMDDELALLAMKQIELRDLVRRYPPPGARPDDPAPVPPAPVLPNPAGGELAEVA